MSSLIDGEYFSGKKINWAYIFNVILCNDTGHFTNNFFNAEREREVKAPLDNDLQLGTVEHFFLHSALAYFPPIGISTKSGAVNVFRNFQTTFPGTHGIQ